MGFRSALFYIYIRVETSAVATVAEFMAARFIALN